MGAVDGAWCCGLENMQVVGVKEEDVKDRKKGRQLIHGSDPNGKI